MIAAVTLTESGRIDTPVTLTGGVLADATTLALFAPVSGSGTLAIGAGATLFAAAPVAAGVTAAFAGAAGTLELFSAAPGFAGPISGFASLDVLDIADAGFTGASWAAGTLTLTGAATLALLLPGSFGGDVFLAQPDGMGGTAVTLATPTPLPAAAGTLTLAGLESGSGTATAAVAGGRVALAGSLEVGSLEVGGLFTVLPGATLAAGTVALAGSLVVEGAVALGDAAASAGTVAIGGGATLAGAGRIDAALDCAGVLAAQGGVLALFGAASGSGTLAIGAGATLFAADALGAGLTVGFGADATLELADPAACAAVPAGLAPGDAVDFGFVAAPGSLALYGALAAAAASQHVRLAATPDGTGGTLVEIACYAAGTRIATPAGEAPVEALREGDHVLALQDGTWRPARVRWVGRGMIDLARHPRPERAAPIRIRAGAIGPGVPSRDLWLSPDHAIFLDGVLVQARALLNGASVVQEFPARIAYVHVELDRHAVLLAEGLPAESYLDTGNRASFAGGTTDLDAAGAAAWDERACAPLLLGGARVAALHARVLGRAQALGALLTEDAALRIEREGTTARLVSRCFVPAWLGLGPDRRLLGVAVASLTIGGRKLPRATFGEGWHAPEPGLRWTNGAAVLHLPREGRLTLRRAQVGARYWVGSRL